MVRAALTAYRDGLLDLILVVCNGAHRLDQGVSPEQEVADRIRITQELCIQVLGGSQVQYPPIYAGAPSARQRRARSAHLPPAAVAAAAAAVGRTVDAYGYVLGPLGGADDERWNTATPAYTEAVPSILNAAARDSDGGGESGARATPAGAGVVLYGMAGATELLYFCKALLPSQVRVRERDGKQASRTQETTSCRESAREHCWVASSPL